MCCHVCLGWASLGLVCSLDECLCSWVLVWVWMLEPLSFGLFVCFKLYQ
ncbi:unnamed protein product [Brassica napus]|uniref:(rape) hypothetical protein n=1 Tax=Brassica napus TaxID=3708 RepID=A0A816SVL5_BRANA|nr:unnamed protein product [Brassica napus]